MIPNVLLKGTYHRVISVKPPDSRLFTEVIFIMRDDAVRDAVSERELIREAERCAESFTESVSPPRERKKLLVIIIPSIILLAAIAAALLALF